MPFETTARNQSVFSGDVQEARDWVKGFIDVGVETIVIRIEGPDQSGQLELCGKKVLPAVRAA